MLSFNTLSCPHGDWNVGWVGFACSSITMSSILEWYMARFGVKNGHPKDLKDTCYDDIGLCGQNVNIISSFTSHTNREGLCNHWISLIISNFSYVKMKFEIIFMIHNH